MREKTREIDQSNMQQKGQTCLSTSCVRSVHFRNKNCICQPGDEMPSSKLFRIPLLETTYLPVLFIHKSAISAYCLFPYSYFGGKNRATLNRASHQNNIFHFFSMNSKKYRFQQLVSFKTLESFWIRILTPLCCLSLNSSYPLSPITCMVIFSVSFLWM